MKRTAECERSVSSRPRKESVRYKRKHFWESPDRARLARSEKAKRSCKTNETIEKVQTKICKCSNLLISLDFKLCLHMTLAETLR